MAWRWMPLFFVTSSPSMLTLVAMGVSPDESVQVEGDSTGSIVGGFAGASVGPCGSLIASALLVKPMKALDGTATDLNDTHSGSIDGAAGGTGGMSDGFMAGVT